MDNDETGQKPTTTEPPVFEYQHAVLGHPGETPYIEHGMYVLVGGVELGYIYETSGGGWVATHKENYKTLAVPGLFDQFAAAEYLYYFAPPTRREI